MMKYGILVTSPINEYKNIGDYIQSLAALQYIPEGAECEFIEKENIASYDVEDKVKTIMNAWYIWHPENWPPRENSIDPLLTSIHITPLTAEKMMDNGGKEYFIKHGPVGCRDTGTLEILQSKGVPSYFSACLTLTLGEKYKYHGTRKGIIFVDPYIPPIRYVHESGNIYYPTNVLKSIGYFLQSPIKSIKLSKRNFFKGRFFFQSLYNACMFYHAYSSMFDDELLMNAEYITHMVHVEKGYSQKSLLKQAEDLVNKYARAELVITSRIHCALPCTGLETPVLFVLENMMESDENIYNAPGRFGGLLNFFRVLNYSNNRIVCNDALLTSLGKIKKGIKLSNKTNWMSYRDNLVRQCKSFIIGNVIK